MSAGISLCPKALPAVITVPLIEFDTNNIWRYDINNGDRLGTGWETVGYDDSTWYFGPAGLGLDTSINGVPIRTTLPYMQDSAPSYFRKHFYLPQTNGVILSLRDVVDDGAVYFINGREVFRHNVSPGVLTFATRATMAQQDPTPIQGPFILPATNLVAGDNVMAVLVVQAGSASSDLEFAAELTAIIPEAPNTPPTVEVPPLQDALVGHILQVTNRAFDSDVPAQTLVFSLEASAPMWTSINPTNGVFQWVPTQSYGGKTNYIRIIVSDDGIPSLSTTGILTVVVNHYVEPILGGAVVTAGQSTNVMLGMFASVGVSNLAFTLEYPLGRLSGLALSNLNPRLATGSVQTVSATQALLNASAGLAIPLVGTQTVAELVFGTLSNQPSAFVPLTIADFRAKRTNGIEIISPVVARSHVAIVGAEPLLETAYTTGGQINLTAFGPIGTTNRIETTSDPASGAWNPWQSVTMTSLMQRLPPVSASNQIRFFRIVRP